MANPITWRNVGATVSGSGAASLMQGADDSVTRGFSALGNVLDERRKLSDENFNTRQTNLAADFQDRVQQAQSLDELNALREDPALAQLRSQLTGEYRNQVRGSLDNRETGLIDQIGNRQEFQDDQTMRDLRPQIADWQARALRGDQSAINEAAAAGVPREDFLKSLYGYYTDGRDEQRATNRDRRDGARLAISQDAHQMRRTDWEEGQAAEQRARDIRAALNRAAQASESGATIDRQALTEELLQRHPDMTQQELATVREGWDAVSNGRYDLTKEDQNTLETRRTVLANQYGMSTNPFYQASQVGEQNSFDIAQDIVDKHERDGGYFTIEGNEDVSRKARNRIMEVLADGLDVDGRTIPVPPAAIDMALRNSGDALFEVDHKFDKALQDILETDAFRSARDNYAQFMDQSELDEIRLRQQLSGRPNRN